MATKKKNPLNLPTQNPAEKLREAAQSKQPIAEKNAPSPPVQNPDMTRVFTDVGTGQASGFEYKGKTYIGATPQEILQTQQNLEARQQQAPFIPQQAPQQQLEESGAFQGVQQAQDLNPQLTNIEGVQPLGENVKSVQAVRTTAVLNSIDQKRLQNMGLEEFQNSPEAISEPFLNELIRTETDLEVLKSGQATASTFGSFIEAIPVAGGLARKYAGGLITTPSSQVDDLVSNIDKLESQISREKEALESSDPYIVLQNLKKYEEQVTWLESKIKILSSQSAELKSAPEELDTINTKIQGTYTLISQVRNKAGIKTIERSQPTTDQAYLIFQNLKSANKK